MTHAIAELLRRKAVIPNFAFLENREAALKIPRNMHRFPSSLVDRPPASPNVLGNTNDLIPVLFGFTGFPIQDKPFCSRTDGKLPRNNKDTWRNIAFDEFHEVGRHRVAVVCDEEAILGGAQSKNFGVINAGMKAEFRRSLKIDRPKPLHRPKNVFVQIVVSLKSNFHSAGSGKLCLRRALSAAPLGNNRAISSRNCSSVASLCATYSSSSVR